jgi:nucleotidyltransferase/DNA polymerase involved in DNA repair
MLVNNGVEKASIDEAYIDVSDWAKQELQSQEQTVTYNAKNEIITESAADEDPLLLAGCKIATKIRQHIKETLQYTCSAGISHNKMLSKLASQLKKPDSQTVIFDHDIVTLMKKTKITKLPKFGSKVKDGDQAIQSYPDKLKFVIS